MSDDVCKYYVEELYNRVLGRTASEEDLNKWLNIYKQETNIQKVVTGIVLSEESINKNGSLNNYDFITKLYSVIFNRAPDTDGLNAHLAYLDNGNSRQNLITTFCNSQEFKLYIDNIGKRIENINLTEENIENAKLYIANVYKKVLQRDATDSEINKQIEIIKKSGIATATYNIINSEESKKKNGDLTDNYAFVEKLYIWILGRKADEKGLEDNVLYLERGNTRKSLVISMIDSEEFKNRKIETRALEWIPTEEFIISAGEKVGDINGDGRVTASDASVILMTSSYIGVTNPNSLPEILNKKDSYIYKYADVNKDEQIDAHDASIILMYAAASGVGKTEGKTVTDYYEELKNEI